MGLITKGMGAVLKHIKKPGKAFTRAGDKWFKTTKKLQRSKKKSERIRGAARIIVPMTVSATAGAIHGIKEGREDRRKRGVYGVERKPIGPKSIKNLPHDVKKEFTRVTSDIKEGITKLKKK